MPRIAFRGGREARSHWSSSLGLGVLAFDLWASHGGEVDAASTVD